MFNQTLVVTVDQHAVAPRRAPVLSIRPSVVVVTRGADEELGRKLEESWKKVGRKFAFSIVRALRC